MLLTNSIDCAFAASSSAVLSPKRAFNTLALARQRVTRRVFHGVHLMAVACCGENSLFKLIFGK